MDLHLVFIKVKISINGEIVISLLYFSVNQNNRNIYNDYTFSEQYI